MKLIRAGAVGAETGQPEPEEPILFGKSTTALLRPRDVVELGIDGLGAQRQQVVAAP